MAPTKVMVTRGTGRFINRPTTTGKRTYDKFFIYIPTELARDSNFPIIQGEEVEVTIDQEKSALVIRPLDGTRARKQRMKATR